MAFYHYTGFQGKIQIGRIKLRKYKAENVFFFLGNMIELITEEYIEKER